MSYVSTLRQWDEAVACVDQGDTASALRVFLDIEEKNSKISFDIGCLHLASNDLDAAEKAFDHSIGKDQHLAVAFFERGITFYKKERFEESLADFQHAFRELRGNQLIDYKPLGLRYKLYSCEVLHNLGLAQAQLGQWEKAQESLLKALALRGEAKFSHINLALEAILRQKLFALVEIQAGLLFKPNKHCVAELEKKDYLGKAKVVASIVPRDEFSGFAPLQPQIEDVPSTPKLPEVLRAFDGEPHTVLYEFVPETSDELAVLPGNLVFVLQKGSDNWASVIFNERRGLVPYNFLEPLDITIASKQEQIDDSGELPGCIVKVHFLYTIVVCVVPGLPYGTILHKISNKLKLPATAITLSYAKAGSGERVTVDDSEMEAVWSSIQNGRLTLWCAVCEGKDIKTLPVTQVVAQYSYEANRPEDLNFHQGDIITVLSKVNEEWLEGQYNGKIGIFPASFGKDIKTLPVTQVVAQYSYEANRPEDLNFHQGDIITVLSKVNEEWLEGQYNGKIGIFPASFVSNQ